MAPFKANSMKILIAIVLTFTVCFTGCNKPQPVTPSSENTQAPAQPKAEQTIRISGAWALYPMMVKWSEEYRALNPNVRIDVSAGGAGKGAADALGGLVDIGMISRSIHEDEIAKGAWFVPVVRDAVFPVINVKNPALDAIMEKGVSQKVLTELWVEGATKTWGQVTGSTNSDTVSVFTRSDACGAAETWAKYLGAKQEDLKGTGVYGDPGLAETVRKDPNGLGFNNLGYAYDVRTGKPVAGIMVLPLDTNNNGRLDASEDFYGSLKTLLPAINEGRYPSPPARDLYLMCKGTPIGPAADFIKYILADGQKSAPEAGYIPLVADKIKAAQTKLDN